MGIPKGAITLAVLALFQLRFRNKALRSYLGILTGVSIIVVIYTIRVYSEMTLVSFQVHTNKVFTFAHVFAQALLLFSGFHFCHQVTTTSMTRPQRVLAYAIPLLALGSVLLDVALKTPLVVDVRDFIVLALSCVIVFFIFRHRNAIANGAVRKAIRVFIIIHAIFLPFMMLYIFTAYIPLYPKGALRFPFPVLLYYLVLSGATLLMVVKHFFTPKQEGDADDVPFAFINEAGLTDREVETVRYLMKGYSAKEIGEALSIATKTVQNHIYSVYQKTHVKNRVDLVNRVHTYGSDAAFHPKVKH